MIAVLFALISSVTIQNPAYDYANAISLQHGGAITTSAFDLGEDRLINATFELTFYSQLNYDNSDDYNVYFTRVESTLSLYNENDLIESYYSYYNINTAYIQNPYNSLELTPDFDVLTSSCHLTGVFNEITLFDLTFNNLDINGYIFDTSTYSWNLSNYINSAESLIKNGNVYGNAYDEGYRNGSATGYQQGYEDGNSAGYIEGFTECYNDMIDNDSTASEIFAGICNIALIPVNFFLMILNFEVFGINIGGFVTGIMTLAIIVILLGVIFGGRPSPSSKGGGK